MELLGKTSQFHQCFMIVMITLSKSYFAFLGNDDDDDDEDDNDDSNDDENRQ